jgi:RNA polymerase sigma-70 factor, ECF subfamily
MAFENMPTEGESISLPAPHVGGAATASANDAAVGALPSLDDKLLIERAQAGERAAFDELVHRYDRDVLRLALSVLHSAEDARDVYQESFLKIYRNLHRFRSECSFYTWIYRIVTNVCLDHLRRRRCRPEDQAPLVTDAAHESTGADFFDLQHDGHVEGDPERCLRGQEIGRRIDAAKEMLSPRERLIFEMKHDQGLKLRDIGLALGTSEETVKNSLFRATRKLRAQLEGLL